ncbi:MAG: MFS transporter [Candidatus Omnitrophica bacterium]|nr:MFS transporter [Candidatus Omnitrophota bacterium]
MPRQNKTTPLNPNIKLLGIVSFLNDLSSEMILPILPLFIQSLGASTMMVGLIGGVRESIASILKVFSGYISDRSGNRKSLVLGGYFSSSVFKFALGLSKVWPQVLIFSGLERVGKGLRTAPRDAIIAESSGKSKGRGFGVHRMFDTAGAVLGSTVVLFLYWQLHLNFRHIILLAAFISFLSLIPLYRVKSEKGFPKKTSFAFNIRSLSRPLWAFLVVSGTFALANFSYMFFILRLKQSFPGHWSTVAPLILYIFFNIFYAAGSVPFGMLSDKIGRKRVLLLGYALFGIICFGFAMYDSLILSTVLFILYGVMNAIIDANQRAYVSDLALSDIRATALGAFHSTTGILALPASLCAGFFWQQFSSHMTFLYGGLLTLCSLGFFVLFWKVLPDKKAV